METDERVRQGSGTKDPFDLVELRDHDSLWIEEFRMERDRLALALGSDILLTSSILVAQPSPGSGPSRSSTS